MLFLTLSYFFFLILGAEWPCWSQRWAFGPKNIFHSIPIAKIFMFEYSQTLEAFSVIFYFWRVVPLRRLNPHLFNMQLNKYK